MHLMDCIVFSAFDPVAASKQTKSINIPFFISLPFNGDLVNSCNQVINILRIFIEFVIFEDAMQLFKQHRLEFFKCDK